MVHLATVHKDPATSVKDNVASTLAKGVDSLKLGASDDNDAFETVYGTRFACQDLPQNEMPEREMPREVAYRMIKDELSLDGNPMLKYELSWT